MLRRQGTPKAVELAEQHELLARWIEHREKEAAPAAAAARKDERSARWP
jgi:hypothetical protein